MSWTNKPKEASHDSPRASQDSAAGSQDSDCPSFWYTQTSRSASRLRCFIIFLVDHRRSATVTEELIMIFLSRGDVLSEKAQAKGGYWK